MYPSATIWFTGHSLGGALASLAASTFEASAVTFNAPGEKLYALRLGLDLKKAHSVFHFGVSSDPIFTGRCNGKRAVK